MTTNFMDYVVWKMQVDNNKIENFLFKIRFIKNTIIFAKETFASFKHLQPILQMKDTFLQN
jgi:hypothetical protein